MRNQVDFVCERRVLSSFFHAFLLVSRLGTFLQAPTPLLPIGSMILKTVRQRCNVSPSPTDVSPTENSWMLHPLDKVSLRDTMSKGRFVPWAQHPRIFGRGHIGRGHIGRGHIGRGHINPASRQRQEKLTNKTPLTLCEAPSARQSTFVIDPLYSICDKKELTK